MGPVKVKPAAVTSEPIVGPETQYPMVPPKKKGFSRE